MKRSKFKNQDLRLFPAAIYGNVNILKMVIP